MRCIIAVGGAFPNRRDIVDRLYRDSDLVIAADSGLDTASAIGWKADWFVGDGDSLRRRSLLDDISKDRVLLYAREKDHSDTELAIDLARSQGATAITIVGGGGGRFDHIVALLSLFHRPNPPSSWWTDRCEVALIDDKLERHDLRGNIVSFFPVGRERCSMKSRGLQWELDGISWEAGEGSGLSNRVVGHTLSIAMITGKLIMARDFGES